MIRIINRAIKGEDDIFNWNYGQSLTAANDYETAEEVFFNVNNQELQQQLCYIASLCRTCIYNGNAAKAWDIYNDAETFDEQDAEYLLELIANDSYHNRDFIVAAKAFDRLHEFDNKSYTEPLICACIGAIRDVGIGRKKQRFNSFQTEETIRSIINILSKHTERNERAEKVLYMIQGWNRSR